MTEQQTLRADARRNRDQIVAAAKVLFAERGADVPMDEIARRAAVGVGTLYRRFPDREALIREVARESLDILLVHARSALADGSTGWESFLQVLDDLPELWFTLRSTVLSPELRAVILDDPAALAAAEELVTVINGLVRAGQEAGTLRADVATGDIVVLVTLVISGLRASAGSLPDAVHTRMLSLTLDGLRPGSDARLPGWPLTADNLSL